MLRRQRIPVAPGLKMIMDDHGSMFGRKRYGPVGTVGVGSLYLFEWIGPILEAIGWFMIVGLLYFGWIDPTAAVLAVFLTTQMIGMAMTMLSVAMMSRVLGTFSRAFRSRADVRLGDRVEVGLSPADVGVADSLAVPRCLRLG